MIGINGAKKGKCYYHGISDTLNMAYRIDMQAFMYLVNEKEAGSFTPDELDNIIIPQLVEQGNDNLLIKILNKKLLIAYDPLQPRLRRLELKLNNI